MPTTLNRPDPAAIANVWNLLKSPLYTFKPRVDCPAEYDQQTSWANSKAKVAVCMGGNRSGKTHSAAIKCARFVTQQQPPPVEDSTFVILSDTYDQVGKICWKEKLSKMIPADVIDWPKCQWMNRMANMPYLIKLKPWPNDPTTNWNLEFHSIEQGRRSFQGRTFYGLWVSEQAEWDVINEVLRGCIDKWYDGAHFMEFTPIDPDLTVGLEEKIEEHSQGLLQDWAFFNLNADKNEFVNPEGRKSFLDSQSAYIRETRRVGKLLSFAGAVYSEWNMAIHVLNDTQWEKVTGKLPPERYCDLQSFKGSTPLNVFFRRGIDWGETPEHPFVCLFGWKDGSGRWFIYDEYVEDHGLLYETRINEIKDRYPWPEHNPHFGMTYADPSRPGNISQFNCSGITTVGASNAIEDGLEYMKQMIQPNKVTGQPMLYVLRKNCPTLIRQMWKYRYMRSSKPGVVVDRRMNKKKAPGVPQDWDNDTCDAVRYLIFSDRKREGKAPSSTTSYDPAGGSRYGVHVKGRYDRRS